MQHYGQAFKPETALKRAEELINVGQPLTALSSLHEWMINKKFRQFSEATELLMMRLIELAVDHRKGKIAKEALHAYKNITLNVSLASIERVVKDFLKRSEEKVTKAQQKADKIILDQIEDLEASETPENILLSTVSSQDNKDRTDREVVTPWLKYLWETFRILLDVLKNNSKLESIYQSLARQAFEFCLKYNRKSEMRRLCELLRQHLVQTARYSQQPNSINLNSPDSMQMHLDTRFLQLNAATQLELWQEAFRSVEDLHTLMIMAQKPPKPIMMVNFYQRLAQIFLVSDDLLFHAAGWNKYYFSALNMSTEDQKLDLKRMSSMVLLSALSVPITSDGTNQKTFEHDDEMKLKNQRLSHLLGLSSIPTRAEILKNALSRNLLKLVLPEIKELYNILEVQFHPLSITKKIEPIMKKLVADPEMCKYVRPLYRVILTRLLQQISQVYSSLKIESLLELIFFPEPYSISRFEIENFILLGCKKGDFSISIDHSNDSIIFDSFLVSSQSDSLHDNKNNSQMIQKLFYEFACRINSINNQIQTRDEHKDKSSVFESIKERLEKEHNKISERKILIDKKKEFIEKSLQEKEKKEHYERQMKARQEADLEQQRLAEEQKKREFERLNREREEIEKQQAQKLAEEMKKSNLKIEIEELEKLDKEKLLKLQIEKLEAEKKEKQQRLNSLATRLDHIERAYRKEEIPLLLKDNEKQKELDLNHHKEAHKMLINASKRQHEVDLDIKHKLVKMKSQVDNYKKEVRSKFDEVIKEKKTESQKKIKEEKDKRINELKEKHLRELERKRLEEEKIKKEQEEKEREEKEKAEKEEQLRIQLLKEKEERKEQMKEAEKASQRQLERERQAEENQKRRMQEKLQRSTPPVERKESSSLDWRNVRDNKPPVVPAPQVTTAATSSGKYVPPWKKKQLEAGKESSTTSSGGNPWTNFKRE